MANPKPQTSSGIISRLLRRVTFQKQISTPQTIQAAPGQVQTQDYTAEVIKQQQAQEEAAEWNEAIKWYKRKKPVYAAQGSSWYSKLMKLVKAQGLQEGKYIEELRSQGLKPIFDSRGNLTGIDTGVSSIPLPTQEVIIKNGEAIPVKEIPSINIPPKLQLPQGNLAPYLQEKERYRQLGYGSKEAGILASSSLRQGGMSYTPQAAQDIILAKTSPLYRFEKKVQQKKQESEAQQYFNKLTQPAAREGEIFYYEPYSNTFNRKLPFGLTPFGKSVSWYRYENGEYVPIEAPKTFVGEGTEVFKKFAYGIEPYFEKVRGKYSRGMYPGQEEEFYKDVQVQVPERVLELPAQQLLISFFSIAMETGATKKGKGKTQTKQKTTLTKKEAEDLIKAAEENIREKVYIQGDKESVRRLLDEAYKSGNSKLIEAVEGSVRNSLDEITANEIISDVKSAYVFPKETSSILGYAAEKIPPALEQAPTIVSGVSGAGSIYAGIGQYEQYNPQEVYLPPAFKSQSLENYGRMGELQSSQFQDLTKTGLISPLGASSSPRAAASIGETQFTKSSNLLKSTPTTKQELIQRSLVRQEQGLRQQQKSALASSSAFGLALSGLQAQRLRQSQRLVTREPLKTKFPKQTRNPFFPPLKKKRKEKKYLRRKRKRGDEFFIPEIRRKGKWFAIGKVKNPFAAAEIGRKRVSKTLAASFRVRKTSGGFIPLATSSNFRYSKKNPFIIVQKKGKRLSSPFEVKEIKAAKKKKKIGEIW